MKRILMLVFFFWTVSFVSIVAQTYYVDAENGDNSNLGTDQSPFKSLERAIEVTNSLTGQGAIIIKVLPGIYVLKDKIDINPVRVFSDSIRYIIEAHTMPDDSDWMPEKMPIIQSVSGNNSSTQFNHATGLLVASNHVTIRGIKFLGNSNPLVDYYYPISKEDKNLKDMVVSQCIFLGDKEAAKIQGGIWAHGPENTITHCVFYGCRNGVLLFNNVHRFTVEHTIVYGAYESAFWFGAEDYLFTFTNNIIAHNANFLVGPEKLEYSSVFTNSVITDNIGLVGYWSREDQKVLENPSPNIQYKQVKHAGNVILNTNNHVKLSKDHLHLTPESDGIALRAGIFK